MQSESTHLIAPFKMTKIKCLGLNFTKKLAFGVSQMRALTTALQGQSFKKLAPV